MGIIYTGYGYLAIITGYRRTTRIYDLFVPTYIQQIKACIAQTALFDVTTV